MSSSAEHRGSRERYAAAWTRLKLARVAWYVSVVGFAALAITCVVAVRTPIAGLSVRMLWVAALATGLVAAVAHAFWVASPCPRCGKPFAGPAPTVPPKCQDCGLSLGTNRG